MTKCDYCGGQHDDRSCPNCGAPSPIETIDRAANYAEIELHEFQRRFWSASGVPVHSLPVAASARNAAIARAAYKRHLRESGSDAPPLPNPAVRNTRPYEVCR